MPLSEQILDPLVLRSENLLFESVHLPASEVAVLNPLGLEWGNHLDHPTACLTLEFHESPLFRSYQSRRQLVRNPNPMQTGNATKSIKTGRLLSCTMISCTILFSFCLGLNPVLYPIHKLRYIPRDIQSRGFASFAYLIRLC